MEASNGCDVLMTKIEKLIGDQCPKTNFKKKKWLANHMVH